MLTDDRFVIPGSTGYNHKESMVTLVTGPMIVDPDISFLLLELFRARPGLHHISLVYEVDTTPPGTNATLYFRPENL